MSRHKLRKISPLLLIFILGLCFNPLLHGEGECKSEEEPYIAPFLKPLSLGECGSITFKPGLRIQTRYLYDSETNNNDFFIRRFRIKGSGDVFGLGTYGAELKIDNTGRFGKDPKAVVENAWVDFTICKELTYLRVGLYDIPFSRNALTSDSKLLFMDRTLVKGALTDLGMADNTIGLLLHGRPYCGRLEYAFGIFDNQQFEKIGHSGKKHSDQLMPAGRVVFNLYDLATPPNGYADYKETYICQGRRLAIGANTAYLGRAHDDDDKFDIYAWGVDLFFNEGRFTVQAEYDWFNEDTKGYGWYVQGGYLVGCICNYGLELAARYQELDKSHDHFRWTSLGMNLYIREHNLKIQTDYTFKNDDEVHGNHDVFQVQLQLDF